MCIAPHRDTMRFDCSARKSSQTMCSKNSKRADKGEAWCLLGQKPSVHVQSVVFQLVRLCFDQAAARSNGVTFIFPFKARAIWYSLLHFSLGSEAKRLCATWCISADVLGAVYCILALGQKPSVHVQSVVFQLMRLCFDQAAARSNGVTFIFPKGQSEHLNSVCVCLCLCVCYAQGQSRIERAEGLASVAFMRAAGASTLGRVRSQAFMCSLLCFS
eukprot:1152633-Pelagomonas_calceolata.AAC.5